MSASEKLKALELMRSTIAGPAETAVMDALAQIRAVVGGQESLCDFIEQWLAHPDKEEARLQIAGAVAERRHALAALDGALPEPTEGKT